MTLITKINTFLKTKYNFGFVKNYPYRSATYFVSNELKNKKRFSLC